MQHKNLSANRWSDLSFTEQMANIGSEVYRTSSWLAKNNDEYSTKAFERALELIDLTIECAQEKRENALKELTRLREHFCKIFLDKDLEAFGPTNKYFHYFALALKR